MRTSAALTILVAFFCVQHTTAATDWDSIAEKVTEIQAFITCAVHQIKTASKEDNPTVGEDVAKKVDSAVLKVYIVINHANSAVSSKKLIIDKLKSLINDLNKIIADLGTNLNDEIAKLTEGPAKRIRDGLEAITKKNNAKSQEIISLLEIK